MLIRAGLSAPHCPSPPDDPVECYCDRAKSSIPRIALRKRTTVYSLFHCALRKIRKPCCTPHEASVLRERFRILQARRRNSRQRSAAPHGHSSRGSRVRKSHRVIQLCFSCLTVRVCALCQAGARSRAICAKNRHSDSAKNITRGRETMSVIQQPTRAWLTIIRTERPGVSFAVAHAVHFRKVRADARIAPVLRDQAAASNCEAAPFLDIACASRCTDDEPRHLRRSRRKLTGMGTLHLDVMQGDLRARICACRWRSSAPGSRRGDCRAVSLAMTIGKMP